MNFQKMMVLVLAAAVWAGCTQENPVVTEEQVSEEQHTTVQFTATLEGKGGGATKALSSDGTATWAENEEIAVYYTKSSGHATATATVTSVTDGKATITATLTDAISGSATLVYPASLHDGSGWLDLNQLYNDQYGNLTDGTNPISTCFDAAMGTGTITVDGENAGINGSVSMVNQLAICAFSLKFVTESNGVFTVYNYPMTASAGLTIKCAGATYQIASDRASNSVSIGGGTSYRGFKSDDIVYVAMLPYSGTVTLYSSVSGYNSTTTYTYTTGSGTLNKGAFYKSIPVTLTPGEPSTSSGTLTDLPAGIYTGYYSSTITLEDGADIRLLGATINVSSGPAIQCLGDATIILWGSNTVSTSASEYPAIQAGGSGTSLTIQGSGSLTATGGDSAAGIGSGYFGTCGDITISGGEVTATGGGGGAGIGSGFDGSCGAITISGGAVTATGGYEGAGIGSESRGTCGTITISGGTVTATGGLYAAGIGSGRSGKFSTITIGSGITSVTATMGEEAQAPIGKGKDDTSSGTVTIDETTSWTAGEATTNLNWSVNGNTWTLTKKSQN